MRQTKGPGAGDAEAPKVITDCAYHLLEPLPKIKFAVEHVTTDDLPSGAPWPPGDNDLWCIVRRSSGCTTWRRVIVQATETEQPAAVTLGDGLSNSAASETER
jgi:hypothetical protein